MMREMERNSDRKAGPGLAKGPYLRASQKRRPRFVLLGSAQSVLTESELRALFAEISIFGDHVAASQKVSLLEPEEPADSLPRLLHSLLTREIFGAQIIYDFWGTRRSDTLLARPEGVVCVRQEGRS